MIRVTRQPEYPEFDREVRKRGAEFLKTCPNPTTKQFKSKNYWSRAAGKLHAAYSGICAYSAMYLPEQGTVDHFLPKAMRPDLAYEWDNLRLASGRINSCKGNVADIVDPFEVQDDWFYMDIPDCLIRSNCDLPKELKSRISNTINSLRLNQDDNYVQERCDILIEFARENITFDFLRRRYPFLAKEVDRQNLDSIKLRRIFRV